jgi:hypothetical protein
MVVSGVPTKNIALLILFVIYFLAASITTFDIRMTQAKRSGNLPQNEPMLPNWVSLFYWVMWGAWLVVLVIDWQVAITIFILKFVLKVVPILETIGNILMSPFKVREKIEDLDSYDKVVHLLNIIKREHADNKLKKAASKNLINRSSISSKDKKDLLTELEGIY